LRIRPKFSSRIYSGRFSSFSDPWYQFPHLQCH